MKWVVYFFILVFPFISYSQTYNSPYTQHFPSGIIEEINRTITIQESEVHIATETPEGKDIHTLKIQEVTSELTEGSAGKDLIIKCVSKDGKFPTTIRIPYQNKIEIIDVIEPSPDGEGERYYRFLVD
ncbi:hypothetical protein SAMN04488034_101798 [Salinimicrobium catena]|uniref:Uncharacterized protein n=1 Tax=Salinimicrobium catena TaxID=390640 RepID=A0A1H5JNL4_9FLAO|nr:hypothetical protein [Salinimicrobium catena]SDL83718.1 hypothetical protein SAMN04488140_11610 [Salinimicrobium catena]SEE54050.1 hypothetical protein SAMN04488034_101798 [Salinimicrobium catena]